MFYENEEANLMQGEINALKQLLSNTDYEAIKYAEGQLSEEEYAELKTLRQSYRDKINTYQEKIKELVGDSYF